MWDINLPQLLSPFRDLSRLTLLLGLEEYPLGLLSPEWVIMALDAASFQPRTLKDPRVRIN
jgi:hypothetical protein